MTPHDIPSAARSDVGQRRDHNEDAVFVKMPLLVVADGVGGSAKGEVASRLAIDTFVAAAQDVLVARSGDEAVRAMEHAVLAANAAVHQSQLDDESRRGMATTITAAVVRDGGEVVVGHVGDSRLYVLSAAGARQLTDDHSVVAELVRSGRLDPGDVPTHPQRNVITRALGPEADVSVDAFLAHVGPGDWLLACSDGLTEHVEEHELARIVVEAAPGDPDAAAAQLVDLANERGGTDNITVALAQPVPSDVSGELHVEALHAAAATAAAPTTSMPATTGGADDPVPAEDSGPLPRVAADGDAEPEASDELPAMQPIPHDEDWRDDELDDERDLRAWIVALMVLIVVFAIVALTWSRSYFLVERGDGSVGIDRGFPVAGLSTRHAESDVLADDLDPADRERLVDSHRILSEADAQQVLDDLPTRLDAVDAPAAGQVA